MTEWSRENPGGGSLISKAGLGCTPEGPTPRPRRRTRRAPLAPDGRSTLRVPRGGSHRPQRGHRLSPSSTADPAPPR